MAVKSKPALDLEHVEARLLKPEIAKELSKLFHYYYNDVHDLSSFASAEKEGKRLEALTNELYSCFHHIARALCETDCTDAVQLEEINTAKNTHLRRLALDAYKVIIASHISDYSTMLKTLSTSDVPLPQHLSTHKVLELASEAKAKFLEAKEIEKSGNAEETIKLFSEAVDVCTEMRKQLIKFDEIYQIARTEYGKTQKKERRKGWKEWIWKIIAALIIAVAGILLGKMFGK